MRCVVHGDSSCPPFCNGAIIAPAPSADVVMSDGHDDEDAPPTRETLATDQRVREVYTAGVDVGEALTSIAHMRERVRDAIEDLKQADNTLGDASELLRKYAAIK